MHVADKFNTPSGSAASHRRIEVEQQLGHAMVDWFNHQTLEFDPMFPGAGSP